MSDPRTCAHEVPQGSVVDKALGHVRSTLEYQGTIAAPGWGHSYACTVCKAPFVVRGAEVIDPTDDDFQPDMPVSWVI